MPDREKVIKGLEILMNGCEYIHCEDCCFFISTKPFRCGLREEQIKEDALALLKEQEAVVRCKDCKHRPISHQWGKDYWYDFPEDSKCPCQVSGDTYYSWCPDDNWFCADGERRDG